MMTELSIARYVCDMCHHQCWFPLNASPKGWVTTKEDHSDSLCPDCNPWITWTKEPDSVKLEAYNSKVKP